MVRSDAATARARSRVYRLLARVYRREPDDALLGALREEDTRRLLEDLGVTLGPDFHDRPVDEVRERLGLEFTELFLGPGAHLSPHESVHAVTGDPREGELWGAQTVKVQAFIRATGLSVADDFPGMPDHVSAELELMERLTAREAQLWEAGDEDNATGCLQIQRRFFREHLQIWIPDFCSKIVARASSRFYASMAELTRGVLDYDFQIISASLPPEPVPQRPARLTRAQRRARLAADDG